MAHKIYLSASTQENNIGVNGYGTEEDNMFILRDRIEYFIKLADNTKQFEIFKNSDKKMTLTQIVSDSNAKGVHTHWANHSNAGSSTARGCEVYYHAGTKLKGDIMAQYWYNFISAVTPIVDRGVHADSVLYSNGLYELRETNCGAALCEHFYHTNKDDVSFYKSNIDLFAIASAKAIFMFYGLIFKLPESEQSIYLDWKSILKKESKWADLYIKQFEKDIKETGYNIPGLIQKLYYKE